METNFFKQITAIQANGEWVIVVKPIGTEKIIVSVLYNDDSCGDNARKSIPPLTFSDIYSGGIAKTGFIYQSPYCHIGCIIALADFQHRNARKQGLFYQSEGLYFRALKSCLTGLKIRPAPKILVIGAAGKGAAANPSCKFFLSESGLAAARLLMVFYLPQPIRVPPGIITA